MPAARSRVVRRMVQVCKRWACATAFWARRAAAGEEPVGSVVARAQAKGVVAAAWIASRAAWWGIIVVGGEVAVGFVELGERESWETGIGRVEEGQVFWMVRSVVWVSDLIPLAAVFVRIV